MNKFISDLHLGHRNALVFDNRPFETIEEQDECIIESWNKSVEYDDDVYILGDISWYGAQMTAKIIKSLNGNKHLIIGNHDKKLLKSPELRGTFQEITYYKELNQDGDNGIVLCHYPIPSYNHRLHKWYHLYGHVHSGTDWHMTQRLSHDMNTIWETENRMYNVGCMLPYMRYTPRTLREIIDGYNACCQ